MWIDFESLDCQRDSEVDFVDVISAIFFQVVDHPRYPGIILKDSHVFELLEDLPSLNRLITLVFTEELEDLVCALNLLFVLTKELEHPFK